MLRLHGLAHEYGVLDPFTVMLPLRVTANPCGSDALITTFPVVDTPARIAPGGAGQGGRRKIGGEYVEEVEAEVLRVRDPAAPRYTEIHISYNSQYPRDFQAGSFLQSEPILGRLPPCNWARKPQRLSGTMAWISFGYRENSSIVV